MNKCFKCGTEFEGKFCPECGSKYEETKTCPQCGMQLDGKSKFCKECGYSFVKQPQDNVSTQTQSISQLQTIQANNTVDAQAVTKELFAKIKEYILKYAPFVLFSLWAVLLWAFYATKLTTDPFGLFDANLYQVIKDEMYSDLFPMLKALLSIAIISNIYITILALIQWKGSNKLKLFANIVGILLQIAIFVCALITRSKVVEFGLENGSFVAIVASFSGVLAVLETILVALHFVRNKSKFGKTVIFSAKADTISIWDVKNHKNLTGITVEPENSIYHSVNNCLIQTKTKVLILGCNNSHVPDDSSVLHLGDRAFFGSRIENIRIPMVIKSIGHECFQNCTKLTVIMYNGTKQQWNKIIKDEHWCTNSAIKTIVCTDGTIKL